MAIMSTKEYINGMTEDDFKKVASLKDGPDFFKYLAEPYKDKVTTASFAMQCQSVGVPNDFLSSSEALHYLVAAINSRLNGNA